MAFSGGGDSLALLAQMAARKDRPTVAAIIDHAIQPQSAAMAQRAAELAERLGAQAIVRRLRWLGPPPRAQAGARRARYRALALVARDHGAKEILLAHTADDQAETILLRASRGSGWRGLAGMAAVAPLPAWPEGVGLLAVRPLLGHRRADLRAQLGAAGLDWIEDPANADRRYARVRTRAHLAALETQGFDIQRLMALARRLTGWAAAEDRQALAGLDAVRIDPFGRLVLPVDALAVATPGVGRRMLLALVAAASGAEQGPEEPALERLRAAALRGGAAGSLGGAAWRSLAGVLQVRRDPGGLTGRAGLAPLAPALLGLPGTLEFWDGRFLLRPLEPALAVAPAGRPPDPAAPEIRFAGGRLDLPGAVGRGLVQAQPLAAARLAATLWRGNQWSGDAPAPNMP